MMRKSMRRTIVLLAVMALFGVTAAGALGVSVHFKHGSPTFTANTSALTLTASGTITGLGNGDIVVAVNGSGTASLLCTNPGGSSKVPGQNPNFSASGAGIVPVDKQKNGNASFSVTTSAPTSPVPGAPDCPNSSWTETITGITWTSATITVWQPCSNTTDPTTCDPPVLNQTFSGPPFPLT
jgi:hypothetical protein